PLGGRRPCTRSIHWPERSARADRFFSAASHLVSNQERGRENPCADRPIGDMARDHKAGGKVEPHATRMDEPMPPPVASGWSGRRVGLAPTGKRRLFTAHTRSGHSISIRECPTQKTS